jgi:D-xylose transport system ATP-binding protein
MAKSTSVKTSTRKPAAKAKAIEIHDTPAAVKGAEPFKKHGTPLIEMRDISIAFGGIKAVDHASIDLHPGEVVAVLGHNGAGKSTLIKVLSGAYKRDHGQIFIEGGEVTINNPRDAKSLGIETIYQTLALADNVDAAANLYLGRELKTGFGTLDDVAMEGAGVKALGGSAPVRGDCPRDPFQCPHPDHG